MAKAKFIEKEPEPVTFAEADCRALEDFGNAVYGKLSLNMTVAEAFKFQRLYAEYARVIKKARGLICEPPVIKDAK